MSRPKGGYKLKDGSSAIGVTTVLNRFKDSGGLLWWSFEQGKAAERGEINGLYDRRDSAADAGTLAHDMAEAFTKGENPDKILEDGKGYSDEVIEQATRAYFSFLHWYRQSNVEVIETEIPLVSEKYRFGGCIDAVGKLNNQLILIDYKTGKGIYTDHLGQLAAYAQLWDENFPDNPITGGYHLCRFDKEHGDFAHKWFPELDDAWEYFKLLLPLYQLDKKLKKRIK